GGDVYWITRRSGLLMRVPSSGGATTTLASGLQGPDSIAIDATGIYVADVDGTTITRFPLACGGGGEVLSTNHYKLGMALDSGALHWADIWDKSIVRLAE